MLEKLPGVSAALLDRYPCYDKVRVDCLLEREIEAADRKVVVLDDDPTGVQTVHGVSVYTDWSRESIRHGFAEAAPLFFILTNSRSFTAGHTRAVHREIAGNIAAVAAESQQEYVIICRGDSTLRGHYLTETQVLRETWEEFYDWQTDGEIICPFFAEGGRYTVDDIHYVKYQDELVPAGQTEFARDKTFGYCASNLRDYVEEKTGGRFPAASVTSISLADLRGVKLTQITNQLMAVSGYNKVIVNAIDDYDLKVFCIALYRALAQGKHFTFRTAAAFVKAFANISSRPLLTRAEMVTGNHPGGGMIIVGSHTQKTTEQLEMLKQIPGIAAIEMNSDLVLEAGGLEREVKRINHLSETYISQGTTVVIYTKRSLLALADDTKEAALMRSVQISDAVQELVGKLQVVPAFVVAKGGITSSDIGTKALRVKRAMVLGQIQPGIPVWQTDAGSRFPGIPYIIFPGNVGEPATLKKAVMTLMGS